MSGYVLFGGVIGLIMAEWKGVGSRPVRILVLGLLVITAAANVVGMGYGSVRENNYAKKSFCYVRLTLNITRNIKSAMIRFGRR